MTLPGLPGPMRAETKENRVGRWELEHSRVAARSWVQRERRRGGTPGLLPSPHDAIFQQYPGGRSSPECPGHRSLGTVSWWLTSTQRPEWRAQEPTHGHKDRGPTQGSTPQQLSLEMSWFGRSCWFAGSTQQEADSSLAVTLIADIFHFLP